MDGRQGAVRLCVLASLGLWGCGGDSDPAGSGTEGGTETTAAAETTNNAAGSSTSNTTGQEGSTSAAAESTGMDVASSSGAADDTGSSTGEDPSKNGPFETCYEDVFVNGFPGINYDPLGIEVGSHCLGTNHQDITNVDRVVFLGDSVTVGTPPTDVPDYYRNLLADALADRFVLSFGADKGLWQAPNVLEGTSVVLESGDFASCAEWGARTDDLIAGNQIEDCYPEDKRDLTTLTIITAGGNDLAKIAQESGDGAPVEVSWELAGNAVTHMRESVEWLKDEENFPNGHHVVFANVYEFTDGTGLVESCQLSGLAGFDPIDELGDALLVIGWIEDQYARIAQDTGSDFVFMFEEFAGHGFRSQDPEAPGYRGPGNDNWFDLTCIHPTPTGHGAISEMFLATIAE